MKQYWIGYVDLTDGCDRESWSVFYAQAYVAKTEEDAKFISDYALAVWMNEQLDNDGELPDYGETHVVPADLI